MARRYVRKKKYVRNRRGHRRGGWKGHSALHSKAAKIGWRRRKLKRFDSFRDVKEEMKRINRERDLIDELEGRVRIPRRLINTSFYGLNIKDKKLGDIRQVIGDRAYFKDGSAVNISDLSEPTRTKIKEITIKRTLAGLRGELRKELGGLKPVRSLTFKEKEDRWEKDIEHDRINKVRADKARELQSIMKKMGQSTKRKEIVDRDMMPRRSRFDFGEPSPTVTKQFLDAVIARSKEAPVRDYYVNKKKRKGTKTRNVDFGIDWVK